MKKNLLLLVLVCLISGVSFGQGKLKKVTSVEGITQYNMESNGLKVLLFPDNSSQTITVNITYLVGSRHEGYGEKGMAHLLEHMVFKGTPNHPDIPKELSSHGARPNGTTWYDRTNYFETFNATTENLEWALDLEADRMVNSYIAKEDLESEFTVVRNEFESGENNPGGVLRQKVIDAAYLWHNYGNSTIGNRSDIERVPIDNLKAFYKNFYRPDNAVLMVTGKFDTEQVIALIEEKFGVLVKPDTPIRDSYTVEPPQDGEKIVAVSRVGDLQIRSALYHTPAGSDLDYSALALIENVLTDAPSGRLYKALIDTKKASSLYSFSPFTKEPGFMYFNVDVPSTSDAAQAEATLTSILDDLANTPITQEELTRAKANLTKQMDQMNRNSAFLATYMSEFIGAGDWRLAFIHRDRIEQMTLDQVNAAAAKYFIPTNRTIGRFEPVQNPVRVSIEPVSDLDALVGNYKGKAAKSTGEAFDVDYDAIQARIESGTLLGKIEYAVIEKDNRGETVTLSFNMRNGDVNSLMNKGLIPSFTASMLNKGTTTMSRQQIEDELSRIKSSINFAGRGGNIYTSISSTKEYILDAVKLASKILKNPSFDAAELEKLKTQQLAFYEQNKSEPGFLASMKLGEINNTYPKGHPNYVMSMEENIAAIKAITVADLKQFYNEFYGLGRATLVGIGTFDFNEIKTFISSEFADFEDKTSYAEIKNPFLANKAAMENIITPDKKNATTYGTLGVKISTYSQDYPALLVAANIMGGGFLNSRIADRLRQKDGVSYGAGGSLNGDGDKEDQNSSLFVYAIYAPQNLDKVSLGFKEEIDRLIADGITQEELDNAVNGWIQGQSVSRAKDNELSSLVNNNVYYYRDMDFWKDMEARVAKLTVADVNAAIKAYFKPFKMWTVVNAGDFKQD